MRLQALTGGYFVQVLANIEAAQRQNRLYDALKQGTAALQALQKVRSMLCCISSLHCRGSTPCWLRSPTWEHLRTGSCLNDIADCAAHVRYGVDCISAA